jgi:hypothetical protein
MYPSTHTHTHIHTPDAHGDVAALENFAIGAVPDQIPMSGQIKGPGMLFAQSPHVLTSLISPSPQILISPKFPPPSTRNHTHDLSQQARSTHTCLSELAQTLSPCVFLLASKQRAGQGRAEQSRAGQGRGRGRLPSRLNLIAACGSSKYLTVATHAASCFSVHWTGLGLCKPHQDVQCSMGFMEV